MSVWCVLGFFSGVFWRIYCQCTVFTKAKQTPAWPDVASNRIVVMNETLALAAGFWQ